jgi:hypothetical protein
MQGIKLPETDSDGIALEFSALVSKIANTPSLSIEKIIIPQFHDWQAAFRYGRVKIHTGMSIIGKGQFPAEVQFFVLAHDWASAVAGAADYEGADWRVPYPLCVFEFSLTGNHHVLAWVQQLENVDELIMVLVFDVAGTWYMADCGYRCQGDRIWQSDFNRKYQFDRNIEAIGAVICPQIKAACVMLEAECVKADTVRYPSKLNAKRVKRGDPPISDYHVVKLPNRRSDSSSAEYDGPPKVRLHFRRGHWRKLADRRTWVRWCLVGDPDLGFIDKHYSLDRTQQGRN